MTGAPADGPGAASGAAEGSLRRDPRDPRRAVATGEVDIAVALAVKAHPEDLAGVVEVDLAGVTFIDSAGLGLLIALARRARPQRLRLVGAPRQARTMLTMLGVERVLDVVAAADPPGHLPDHLSDSA